MAALGKGWGGGGGAVPASPFLVEDPQKPLRCPFELEWEVWHQQQVGPALLVCFSFSFITNLGYNPGHPRVPDDQLFQRSRVSLCTSFVWGLPREASPR